jgi:hypothetical protein
MKIEIEVSENLKKKLHIMNVLQGENNSDFELGLSKYVEEYIEAIIEQELRSISVTKEKKPMFQEYTFHDTSVAEGLSNEDIEEEEEEEEEERTHGLTLADLEADNKVEDPEHEAISPDDSDFTFEDLLGISSSYEEEEKPEFNIPPLEELVSGSPRGTGKGLPKYCKAKVSAMQNAPSERDLF